MKSKKYHTVSQVPEFNRNITERCQIGTPNKQIHTCTFSWFSAGTSIKSVGVKQFSYAQTSPLNEMMRSYKCFPLVRTMSILLLVINGGHCSVCR